MHALVLFSCTSHHMVLKYIQIAINTDMDTLITCKMQVIGSPFEADAQCFGETRHCGRIRHNRLRLRSVCVRVCIDTILTFIYFQQVWANGRRPEDLFRDDQLDDYDRSCVNVIFVRMSLHQQSPARLWHR